MSAYSELIKRARLVPGPTLLTTYPAQTTPDPLSNALADAIEAQAKAIEELEAMRKRDMGCIKRASIRIAELEAALKDLREAAYDVDEMDMPFSQRNEWGCCLAKADEALKGEK